MTQKNFTIALKNAAVFGVFVLAFILSGFSVAAQSQNPDSPTVLTSNLLENSGNKGEPETYYYTFTVNPGTLKITTDAIADKYSAVIEWYLLDTNFKAITRDLLIPTTSPDRTVKEVKFVKAQKVILKLVVGGGAGRIANYKLRFDGAVKFSNAAADNIQELGDENENSQKLCVPRNGTLVITYKDGRKVKLDMSKVQTIDVQ